MCSEKERDVLHSRKMPNDPDNLARLVTSVSF
jgi:hypothetical protein